MHNAWPQAWQEIGNDPDNEVLIITGPGGQWLGVTETIAADPADEAGKLIGGERPKDFAYGHPGGKR